MAFILLLNSTQYDPRKPTPDSTSVLWFIDVHISPKLCLQLHLIPNRDIIKTVCFLLEYVNKMHTSQKTGAIPWK